jgi:hypothetical protein
VFDAIRILAMPNDHEIAKIRKKNALVRMKHHLRGTIVNLGTLIARAAGQLRVYACRWSKNRTAVIGGQKVDLNETAPKDFLVKTLMPALLIDGEIASAAAYQIDRMTSIPSGIIEITVHEGRVTLEGAV